MAHDVFVSYSVKDKVVADAIVAKLEAASIRCWIAPRDVIPGADWGESIIDAIESSRIMILVFSRHANASRQIKREVERADDKGVYTIPFRIDEIEPSKSLEYFISTAQWMNAFPAPLEPHLDALAQTVASVLANTSRSETAPNEPNPAKGRPAAMTRAQLPERRQEIEGKARRPWPLRSWMASVAMVVILISAGTGWYLVGGRSHPKTSVIPEGPGESASPSKRAPDVDSPQAPETGATKVVRPVDTSTASETSLPTESQTSSVPTPDAASESEHYLKDRDDQRRHQGTETPVDLVRRYYGQINERFVDQAYACLSRDFKTRVSPERFSKVFADTQAIVVRQLNDVSLGDEKAIVAIAFKEMDRDNQWHDWSGSVYLVKEGDAWRIDRTALKSDRDQLQR